MKQAAFDLHQAAETAFKTILIVFTGYVPDEHYLSLLGAKAGQVDPRFGKFFQAENATEQDAYTKLEYAYIGARYDKRYTIDELTVRLLAERVAELLRVTGEKCRDKIAALEQAPPA